MGRVIQDLIPEDKDSPLIRKPRGVGTSVKSSFFFKSHDTSASWNCSTLYRNNDNTEGLFKSTAIANVLYFLKALTYQ